MRLQGKVYVLLFTLMTIALMGYSQRQSPIFASKLDSVAFARTTKAIDALVESDPNGVMPGNPKFNTLDSLRKIQLRLFDKIVGYRYAYTADKSFTPMSDLLSGNVKAGEITKLSLADMRTRTIPRQIYSCSNLEELELVNTRIRRIPSRLSKLFKLRRIYVYNNVAPRPLKLGKNSNVNTLVIRGTQGKSLPTSYRNFMMLDSLDLSRNINMTHFPQVYQNKTLRKLSLRENLLTLSDLKDGTGLPLQELNLMRNRIKIVPDAIASFSELRKLTFTYNEIESIPPGIGKLKKLESLSFYRNKLGELPPELFQLTNLSVIDLYYNNLRAISPGISKLTELKVLYLSNNQLTSLPDNIGDLTKLQELYIHNNKLSALPESVARLKGLRVLRMNDNLFSSFPEPVLALTNLENLDISKNLLHILPLELSQFPKLQILVLIKNPFENQADVARVKEELQARGAIVHTK
ncbi:MAG: leucine-rich repeat domain-containing protein [Bacteroidetes bacterium]|nr:leucine-rich repeat domain-containing protein [Bacteroidota bacterium]